MSNDALRRGILATVTELQAGHQALGLPAETRELIEVRASIARIERAMDDKRRAATKARATA